MSKIKIYFTSGRVADIYTDIRKTNFEDTLASMATDTKIITIEGFAIIVANVDYMKIQEIEEEEKDAEEARS